MLRSTLSLQVNVHLPPARGWPMANSSMLASVIMRLRWSKAGCAARSPLLTWNLASAVVQ